MSMYGLDMIFVMEKLKYENKNLTFLRLFSLVVELFTRNEQARVRFPQEPFFILLELH